MESTRTPVKEVERIWKESSMEILGQLNQVLISHGIEGYKIIDFKGESFNPEPKWVCFICCPPRLVWCLRDTGIEVGAAAPAY